MVSRLLTCYKGVPGWLVPFGVSPYAHVVEVTTVDPVTRQMVVRSRNLTGSSLITINEHCVYKQPAENRKWTHYAATAEISAFLPFLSGKFERYSHDTMIATAEKGAMALENICHLINLNGVLSLIPNPNIAFCDDSEASEDTSPAASAAVAEQ